MNGIIKPVYGPDYGRLLLQAFQTARQYGALEDEMARREREEQLTGLMSQAPTDPQALRQLAVLDPARARQFQLAQTEREEGFRRRQALTSSQIEGQPLDRQIGILNQNIEVIQKRGGDPSNMIGLRDMLSSNDPRQVIQGQNIITLNRQQGEREGFLRPTPALKPEGRTALAKNLELLRDPSLSPEERQLVLANLTGAQQEIEVTPEGGIRLRTGRGVKGAVGPSELQRPTVRKLEQQVIEGEQNLLSLDRIAEQYKPGYLTYLGRGKAWWSAVKSKAGIKLTPQAKKELGGRRAFTQNINRLFNAYRKNITGAQATMNEIEFLKKAMLNENLGPAEFEAAYTEYRSELARSQRLKRKILREGIMGNFRNKRSEAAKELDRRFLGLEDDSALDRIEELKDSHNEDQIYDILIREGYNLN